MSRCGAKYAIAGLRPDRRAGFVKESVVQIAKLWLSLCTPAACTIVTNPDELYASNRDSLSLARGYSSMVGND